MPFELSCFDDYAFVLREGTIFERKAINATGGAVMTWVRRSCKLQVRHIWNGE